MDPTTVFVRIWRALPEAKPTRTTLAFIRTRISELWSYHYQDRTYKSMLAPAQKGL